MTREAEDRTREIEKVRGEILTSRKRDAYFVLVMVLTVLAAAGSSILVSVVLTQRSERKFCAIVINIDDGYRRVPPSTDAGRQQAMIYSQLRAELGCDPSQAMIKRSAR